ncbi:hypothetical protein RND81_02G029300, partial [Saponaria officinalis]
GGFCFDSSEDIQLQKQFKALNVTDVHCASLLQTFLCVECDQHSADRTNTGNTPGTIPCLCTSASSAKLYQSKIDASSDLCTKLWNTCGNLSIYNSIFTQPRQENTDSSRVKLTDKCQSKKEFCKAFGGSPENKPACHINDGQLPNQGICIEKIGNGSYVSMAANPDGSDSIFLTSQKGIIWLATLPKEGSDGTLNIDKSRPFLDISDQVLFQSSLGLLSMALHPNFNKNGRFFVSFTCDKLQHSGCSGRCACNTEANCDPGNLGIDDGLLPCQYHNVVAEFSANSTRPKVTPARSANPLEVRRIFTMGLPSHDGHAGQILFGPEDGYLYYLVGDESQKDAPYRFSQNKKSVLGKILRIDVDKLPSAKKQEHNANLWGNYSIPKDNPNIEDKELLPEIWALGFHLIWRCSFDSERPSYFLCDDPGQTLFDEVNIITKGGNYGWPIYEGPFLHNQPNSSENTAIKPIFPVMGYNDPVVARKTGSASLIGGYTYRSNTDPCLFGRYLYTDVYANTVWVGTENPKKSGKFTSKRMPWRCAKDSPIQCNSKPGSHDAFIGYAFSFGEDNRKDVYLLASSGVYKIVHPSRCNFVCSKNTRSNTSVSHAPVSSSSSPRRRNLMIMEIIFYVLVTYVGYQLANQLNSCD